MRTSDYSEIEEARAALAAELQAKLGPKGAGTTVLVSDDRAIAALRERDRQKAKRLRDQGFQDALDGRKPNPAYAQNADYTISYQSATAGTRMR